MEHLWAPWRLAYVQDAGSGGGCVFCAESAGKLGPESLVVHRGERVVVLLNKFPYSSGHLMVAPVRHTPALGDLDADEAAEIHALTVAGGSISGHLHEHIVPRWGGDTNFMPVLADVKVLPEHLEASRERIGGAWS